MNIKRMKPSLWHTVLFTGALSVFLSGCSREESVSSVSGDYPICLLGSVEGSGISGSTRGALDGSSTGALDVSFALREQQADGYPSYATIATSLNASRAAVVGSTAGAITFAIPQYYQMSEASNNTALVGWYPQVGAGSTYAAGVITFGSLASGVTDVMLTKEQMGNKTAEVGAFTFEHALAQIQVKAKAADAAVSGKWGKITGITLKGVNTSGTVTLPTGAPTADALTPVFSNQGEITLKVPGSDTDIDLAAVIPATAGATGSVFCYGLFPPTGGNTLSLDVTTELGGTREVIATLSSGTVIKGNIYTVTLEFKSTGINPTATISDWGIGSGATVPM